MVAPRRRSLVEYVLDLLVGPGEKPLPPGNYTAKVRDVVTDPKTGKVTITFGDVKPNTTPQPTRGPMKRLVRRKE